MDGRGVPLNTRNYGREGGGGRGKGGGGGIAGE